MFSVEAALAALAATLIAASLTWLVSLARHDVSIIDSMWAVMVVVSGLTYFSFVTAGPRFAIVITLVLAWALRLAIYITWRNHGEPEDSRYRQIRERNQPHFEIKSLYLVFWLQGVLAWIVSWPVLAAISSQAPIGWLDYAGWALFAGGLVVETIADWQLARFKSSDANRGRVLDSGLWRYTRHPNYFGEFCVWWGAFLSAASAGAWASIVSPLLMTLLLLRVSGVALLEKDIGNRRPEYAHYRARTNAFFPGPPRRVASHAASGPGRPQ